MIAFCTTCRGRTKHLEQTLPKNIADNADYEDCKFVLVNYNDKDGLVKYLKDNHQGDIDSGRLVVYNYYDFPTFRMAHAKNVAHRCGLLEGGDILVNLDADNLTGKGFAKHIEEKFWEPNIFLWSHMVKGEMRRGISGRIAVKKEAFTNAGGYDEKFVTWSSDDKDFNIRLQNLGYLPREIDRQYLNSVNHNDKMRFKEYPEISIDEMDSQAFSVQQHGRTVSNYGKVGKGTVYRNFSEEPICLANIPTRIFGVGLHKTGTTSLHHALRTIGFQSAHWKNAHWAKAIWTEMQNQGRSPTLEKSYALSDLPIAILYRQLDHAYPGSKFILTTRSEDKWLKSIENHWNPATNQFREQWDHDPFTHKIHTEIYGRKKFDPDVFLARFRRHNAEVLDYFKDRPNDLLVLDIDKGVTWEPLCKFLDRPIPDAEFPRVYQTGVVA